MLDRLIVNEVEVREGEEEWDDDVLADAYDAFYDDVVEGEQVGAARSGIEGAPVVEAVGKWLWDV